jgi:hypothetical protein
MLQKVILKKQKGEVSMAKRKFRPEGCTAMGAMVPPQYREQAIEIQVRNGDVSLAQVWRRALQIGLAQLMKDIKQQEPAGK